MFLAQPNPELELSETASLFEMDDIPIPETPHTLESYAEHHFNPPPKKTLTKALQKSLRNLRMDSLWLFSRVNCDFFLCVSLQFLSNIDAYTTIGHLQTNISLILLC